MQKQLRITLTTSGGAVFPGTNSSTLILTGLRMNTVTEQIARLATTADIRIYGMDPADMNALTILFFKTAVLDQTVLLEANDGSGWTQVFAGTMIEAQPDYSGAPDVFFHIQATFGYFSQVESVKPTGFTGSADVVQIIGVIAGNMGLTVENNGVSGQLSNPYFPGTYFDQLKSVCQAANVDFYIDGTVLAITPANQPRQNPQPVIIGQQSGLIGYPVFQRFGITVSCIWNPGITGGSPITVQSDLPGANGNWTPLSIRHTLDSMVPGGQWKSELQCFPVPT